MTKDFYATLNLDLKKYGIEKVTTPLMLRESLEEFLIKNGNQEIENNQIRAELYFIKESYIMLLKGTKSKPKYTKEDLLKTLESKIERGCQTVNNLGKGFLITDTSETAFRCTQKIQEVLVDDWYKKYKSNVKLTKPDPKGFERLLKLSTAYDKECLNNKSLCKGRIQLSQANGGRISFYHNKHKEMLVLNLVNRREVAYAYEEGDTREVKQSLKGGAVSTTSISEVKKYVKEFIYLTKDPNYWLEVYKLIDKNI